MRAIKQSFPSNAHFRDSADWVSDFLARLAELLRNSRVLLPLQVLALWPVWRWYGLRMGDGSDEPLGPLALGLALLLLYGRRRELRAEPRAVPLLMAGLLTLAQAAASDWPPLVRALLGITALGCSLAAFLPKPREAAPLWVLLALSLPLVASLQFYGGYPLRRLAAEGAGWLLQSFGLPVLAEGAGLRWGQRLMVVDAPCSGVHMLWVGLVMASAASAVANAAPGRLLLNLGLAVALVLVGNVLRNAALFFKETGLASLPAWTHEGIGLALFVLVLVPVALVCLRRTAVGRACIHMPDISSRVWASGMSTRPVYGLVIRVTAMMFLSAAAWSAVVSPSTAPVVRDTDFEWPTRFQGRELIRLPLVPAEIRWLRDFPGAAARFTDGERELLIRRVERPTRMLHPAADCFRGVGYAVGTPEIREVAGARWSCFVARKDGVGRAVCERIHDEHGGAWTDASAWYWSALLESGRGPWWAVTVAGM
ncbi:archaeosortase/exosortase family protein [Methylomagnum sp.]